MESPISGTRPYSLISNQSQSQGTPCPSYTSMYHTAGLPGLRTPHIMNYMDFGWQLSSSSYATSPLNDLPKHSWNHWYFLEHLEPLPKTKWQEHCSHLTGLHLSLLFFSRPRPKVKIPSSSKSSLNLNSLRGIKKNPLYPSLGKISR